MRLPVQFLLASALTLLCAGTACVSKNAGAASPDAALPPAQVNAYLVIPSFDTCLAHVAQVANAFQPGSMQPAQLKAMLGAMCNDPELKFLAADKPIVLALLRPDPKASGGEPPLALFLPVNDPKPLQPILAQQGMLCRVEDGLLVAASDPAVLERAAALGAGYRDILAKHAWKHDVHFKVNVEGINEAYGEPMREGIASFASLMEHQMSATAMGGMQPQAAAKVLNCELKALLGMFNQTKSFAAGITLGKEAIQFEYDFAAKKGTTLADLLATPSKDSNLLASFPEQGAVMSFYSRLSPTGMAKGVDAVVAAMQSDPDFKTIANDVGSKCSKWFKAFAGEYVFNLNSAPSALFGYSCVFTVTDPEAAVAACEALAQMFAPGSAVAKWYAEMGIPMTTSFEKGAREQDGVAVHRFEMAFDLENLPPEQQMMLEQMPHSYEFATVGKLLVMAADAEGMNALITKAKRPARGAAVALHAAAVFGSDQDLYADFNIAGFIRMVMAMMPFGDMSGLVRSLESSEPIVWAATIADGTTQGQVKVPLQPFITIANGVQSMFSPAAAEPRGFETLPNRGK